MISRSGDTHDSGTGGAPAAVLLDEDANDALRASVIDASAGASNRGRVRQHGHIRRRVTNLDIVRVEFVESALGIHDLIDLLFLIYNKTARVNLNKVVGEQPLQSP